MKANDARASIDGSAYRPRNVAYNTHKEHLTASSVRFLTQLSAGFRHRLCDRLLPLPAPGRDSQLLNTRSSRALPILGTRLNCFCQF
jgi:hypothetical protein